MAILNYLIFLPESKGGLEYVEGWSNYGLAASILFFSQSIFPHGGLIATYSI